MSHRVDRATFGKHVFRLPFRNNGGSMNFKYGSYGYDFELLELNEDQYDVWDLFVNDSPQGTAFHKISWLQSFDDYTFRILALIHKKTLVAGIPLVYTSRLGIKFAMNPPFTPYLGIIFRRSNQKYNTKLSFEKKFSKVMAKKLKNFAPYIEYGFHYNFVDPAPFIWNGFSVKPYYTYVLNLEKHQNAIWEDMEKDTRNRISRAERYDLKCVDGSPTELAELISLSYKRKNQKPLYSKQVYEKSLKIFFKNVPIKSMILKNNDKLIAGGAFVYDHNRAYYLCAGISSDSEFKGTNQLVVWTLIKHAGTVLGLKEFDFEGWPNEGVERFLRGFGGNIMQGVSIYNSSRSYYALRVARILHSKMPARLGLK
jgi:hypothetical protein